MKFYFLFVSLLLLLSCTNHRKKKEQPVTTENTAPAIVRDSFPTGEVIPVVASSSNNAHSFALYLPDKYRQNKNLPVLIFLDPHGDGSFPLTIYRSLAEKFGVAMLGSNDSKNGLSIDESVQIAMELNKEAARRFKLDSNQISLAGFSGGAKVALAAASQMSSLLSVIYCGAGLPQLQQSLSPALAIAGLKDMNYTEVVQMDRQMEQLRQRHALITWSGKHEWSDTATFQNAFYWIRFRSMEKKYTPFEDDLVRTFTKQNTKHFSEPLLEERRLVKLISFLENVTQVSTYNVELQALSKQQKYLSAKAKEQSDVELESRMKQNYLQCITLNDPLWWRDEVNRMRLSGSNPMNDRILGYISLACYSYSNNALNQQDLASAEKYLAIYAIVDRENPDRAFMQACLYGWRNNKAGAIQSISDAILYGFKDKSKLLTEPSLSAIRNTPEFNELIRKIK